LDTLREPRVSPRKTELGRFLRAQVSSLAATGVDWALMILLVSFRAHYAIAVAVGHVAGAATDFAVKKYWAFGAGKGGMEGQAFRYFLAWAGSLALNEFAAWLLISEWSVATGLGVILASLVVGLLWNYPLHRYFVFGKKLRKD
jgi:putative flippase GtrA